MVGWHVLLGPPARPDFAASICAHGDAFSDVTLVGSGNRTGDLCCDCSSFCVLWDGRGVRLRTCSRKTSADDLLLGLADNFLGGE